MIYQFEIFTLTAVKSLCLQGGFSDILSAQKYNDNTYAILHSIQIECSYFFQVIWNKLQHYV